MKTAIYIEDGVVQLVITPETEFEKNSMSTFYQKPMDAQLFEGSFYDCRGGWVRQSTYFPGHAHGNDWNSRDRSLILTTRIKKTAYASEQSPPDEDEDCSDAG